MRTFQIGLALFLVGLAGYAYAKNPAGCWKIVDDFGALYNAVSPFGTGVIPPSAPGPTTVTKAPPLAPPPAPVTVAVPKVYAPLPPNPLKTWAPPAVIPSQPNWTWTTSDGKTYQNVTITEIKTDTVTIMHSLGVAHIDISTLPEDIQKQLNYDPVAAKFAQAEKQREEDHPYYRMDSVAEAQSVARQLHWPLAWVSVYMSSLSPDPSLTYSGDGARENELSQVVLGYLKDKSVIILIDADHEMPQTPGIVHHQFSQYDDGQLGGANYMPPKVVFSSPDATQIFGRVSYTQMKAAGMAAIDSVLTSIQNDPADQTLLNGPPAGASATPASP